MGEEIVLLKIELDPQVASVFQHQLLPKFAMDLVPDSTLIYLRNQTGKLTKQMALRMTIARLLLLILRVKMSLKKLA
jgi:hypothetical protein